MNQGKYIFAQLTDFEYIFTGQNAIKEILTKCDYNNVKELKNNQLIISEL
jgi:hypothetical protein